MAGASSFGEVRTRELITSHDITMVRVEAEDINGVSRGFTVDADYFLRSVVTNGHGIPQAIYALENSKCEIIPDTGVLEEVGYGNCYMYPDLAAFHVLPWEPNMASVLSTVRFDGCNSSSPLFPISPRTICKGQLDKLREMGLQLYSTFEFEFYLLSETALAPVIEDLNVLSTHNQTKFLPLVRDIFKGMKGLGIRPEVHHAECGPGQQEVTISPEFGIAAPDNAFRFKHMVKEVAAKHEMLATFLSMPLQNEPGSSGHFNHSLWDMHGNCVMYNTDGKYGFSETAEHWLAGLVHHSSALMALAAPFGNCFERVNPDMNFAPYTTTWGYDDRTVAYRIKNKNTPKMYIENRMAGGAVNPYLLVAGCIVAGMDGLAKKLKLTDPHNEALAEAEGVKDSVKNLPTTLTASLECLLNDDLFVKELGPEFMRCFVATRQKEIQSVENARGSLNESNFFQWYRKNYAKYV